MSISLEIKEEDVKKVAVDAIQSAVNRLVNDSPMLKKTIETAIATIMVDVNSQLKAAIEKAVMEVTSRPTFLHAVIEKAILNSSDKLSGAFDASLRSAGKQLALDRSSLTALSEEVKARIAAECEINGTGSFS